MWCGFSVSELIAVCLERRRFFDRDKWFKNGRYRVTIVKEHKEFHAVDMQNGWHVPPGYPEGMQQKILTGSLNEDEKQGNRTRLLRFEPAVFTTKPFVHDYWEEVYLVSGDLTVGNDENGNGGEAFQINTYACRPPGAYHGPFKSEGGCVLLEIHYYD